MGARGDQAIGLAGLLMCLCFIEGFAGNSPPPSSSSFSSLSPPFPTFGLGAYQETEGETPFLSYNLMIFIHLQMKRANLATSSRQARSLRMGHSGAFRC